MQLTPRYDGPPLLDWAIPIGDPLVPLARQRRRLSAVLASLDDDQWEAPTRCERWSVRDVIAHLADTNAFWTLSIDSGRQGRPTRFLTGFDPVATPAALVDATREQPSAAVLARFDETTEALLTSLDGLDDQGWRTVAESPPGHVPLCAVVAHALWDAWVHERDIALPLGLDAVEEPDEISLCLTYAAALSPLFLATNETPKPGTLVVDATEPDVHLVIDLGPSVTVRDGTAPAGAAHVTGAAVALLEGLSFRQPLDVDVAPEQRWMLTGLASVFDVA